MIDFQNLKIDSKDVQYMYIDGNKAYSLMGDKVPSINSEAKTILDNATFVKDDSASGVDFKVWDTYQHQFCQVGVGNVHCWYLTPHLMVSANHYGSNKPVGDYTLQNGTVVKKLAWNNIRDWALAHGGESKYYGINLCGDIDIITLDKSTAIPTEYLPWLMPLHTMRKYFLKDIFGGCVGFKTSQRHQYGVPIVFENSVSDWHSIYNNDKCPEDMKARVEEMGQTTPSYTGDSGRPIYLMIDGKPVVVSQYRSTEQGPALVYCWDIIRDFAKEYEGEDLIKWLT